MKTRLFVLFLLIGISFSFAQTSFQQNYIEVRGNAEMEVAPDIVLLKLIIRETMDGRTKLKIDQLEAQLLKILRKVQIPEENLKVEKMAGIQEKIRRKQTDLMSSKSYLLKVTNLDKLDDLQYELDKIAGLSMGLAGFENSKLEEFKDELYIKAMKNAKHKATVLLGALNQQPGNILYVNEGYLNVPIYRTASPQLLLKAEAGFSDNNVAMQEMDIKFEVRVRFEILTIMDSQSH